MTVSGSYRTKFITSYIFIMFTFSLQKYMDSLQEAFNHPPKPCEALFIVDGCALLHVVWTVEQKHSLTFIIKLVRARTIFFR